MKIILDKETCIGCGTCVALCPGTFAMNNEDGKVDIISQDDAECAQRGAESCPVSAIVIEE